VDGVVPESVEEPGKILSTIGAVEGGDRGCSELVDIGVFTASVVFIDVLLNRISELYGPPERLSAASAAAALGF